VIEVNVLVLDSNMRELLGKNKVLVTLQEKEATIEGLIKKLAIENEKKVYKILSKLNTSVLVNGQDIDFLQGINTKLSVGDRVAIIPLAAGG
jgi:molybdopterin converting factor small subunit